MATGPSAGRPLSFAKEDDPNLWQEQNRLYNFLKHYDLHQYYTRFVDSGIKRLTHLKDVSADDASLEGIGLSRPERIRLRKKVKENVESFGKFKKKLLGKSNKFDDPTPEVAHAVQDQSTASSRTAAIIPKDQIKMGERIGEGAHGAVHEGTWSNVHGSVLVAVKRLYGRQEVQSQFIKEANSMCTLNHQNIIRLYGIVLSEPLMLIEELAPLGNLHSYLHKNGTRLTVRIFYSYTCQIADAMKYLEKNRIVHRDLATRNILLVQEDSIKLSDFGMARVLDEQSDVYNLSNLGARIPVAWTAIEALTRAKFSTASDVWSYGVVLWEIYSLGQTPFEGLSPVEIRDLLMRGDRLGRPERCPCDIYSVMETCWNINPHDRPSFHEVHQRVLTASPKMVRAIQSHDVSEDNAYLSFKTGDLVYVIDKPKPEWIFGMSADGAIGQLSSDHVSNVVDALGDIKAKVSAGKVKASALSISDPTSVDHMLHWGRDGTKWNSNDQELGALGGYRQTVGSSPQPNGRVSPRSASPTGGQQRKSTYLRIVSRSPSPGTVPQSPLVVGVTSPIATTYFAMTTAQSPTESSVIQSFSPRAVTQTTDSGFQISYGDAKFVGTQRYVANRESFVDESQPREDGSHLRPQSPPDFCRQVSEDNSYIHLSRSNVTDPEVLQRLAEAESQRAKPDSPAPEEGYIKMVSHSILAGNQSPKTHSYVNYPVNVGQYREEVPAYAVSSGRGRINSEPTHSGATQSLLDEGIPSSDSMLPNPLQPVPTAHRASSGAASQYSVSGETGTEGEALTPQVVRFFNSGDSSSKSSRSLNLNSAGISVHTSQPRPVIAPSRSTSYRESTSNWLPSTDSADPRRGVLRRSSEGTFSPQSPSQPVAKPRQGSTQPKTTAGMTTVSQSLQQQPLAMPIPEQAIPSVTQSVPSRVGIHGNPSYGLIISDPEFSDTQAVVIRRALQKHNNDSEKAKEEIRINKLIDMCIPNITEADCKRALSHCQQKTDRAAEWLLQLSDDIEERAQ